MTSGRNRLNGVLLASLAVVLVACPAAKPCGSDLDCSGDRVCEGGACQPPHVRWTLTWTGAVCADSGISAVRALVRGAQGPVLEAPCEAGRVSAGLQVGPAYAAVVEGLDGSGAVKLRGQSSVQLTGDTETAVELADPKRVPAILALSWVLPGSASCAALQSQRVGLRFDGEVPVLVDCAAGAFPEAFEVEFSTPPAKVEVLAFDETGTTIARRAVNLSPVAFSRSVVMELR